MIFYYYIFYFEARMNNIDSYLETLEHLKVIP